MCKRKVQEFCSTLSFLLGGVFGISVALMHEAKHINFHVFLLVVVAGLSFHLNHLIKDFAFNKKS